MTMQDIIFLLGGAAILLIGFILLRPASLRQQYGKIITFIAVFILPLSTLLLGGQEHLEKSKKTEFCLSCHEMTPYGKSLMVDDEEYVPASHYQNKRIARDNACFSCHTTYTMYGDISAKLRGLRHLYVHYFSSPPDTIKLYEKFSNRECLHCHEDARTFEKAEEHHDNDTMMAAMKADRMSCTESGCHDVTHDAHGLDDVEMWKEVKRHE